MVIHNCILINGTLSSQAQVEAPSAVISRESAISKPSATPGCQSFDPHAAHATLANHSSNSTQKIPKFTHMQSGETFRGVWTSGCELSIGLRLRLSTGFRLMLSIAFRLSIHSSCRGRWAFLSLSLSLSFSLSLSLVCALSLREAVIFSELETMS